MSLGAAHEARALPVGELPRAAISGSAERSPGSLDGFVSPGFEAVVEQFQRNIVERGDRGAAFAVFVDGKPVVDLWGGLADRRWRRPWRRDTVVGIFSGTKGLVATCLLLLMERGALDLEKPVCTYWPEFEAHDKGGILVRHVVAHQAGLPGLTTPVTPEEATDDKRMAQLLAEQPAICPPGTRFYYHALTFGWLCGELVRRVDGRSVGRFFDDEVAGPLGLDAWIGLPQEHEGRVATLEAGPGFVPTSATAAAPSRDGVGWSIWANPPRFSAGELPANAQYWRAAEIPASNGVATARSLARLYGCLGRGGGLDGFRLLSPSTIALGATRLAGGVEPYLQESMAFGVGFELQTDASWFGPDTTAYGHRGAGGSVHGAWPERKTGFSYVTSSLHGSQGADPRSAALLRALHDALGSGDA